MIPSLEIYVHTRLETYKNVGATDVTRCININPLRTNFMPIPFQQHVSPPGSSWFPPRAESPRSTYLEHHGKVRAVRSRPPSGGVPMATFFCPPLLSTSSIHIPLSICSVHLLCPPLLSVSSAQALTAPIYVPKLQCTNCKYKCGAESSIA